MAGESEIEIEHGDDVPFTMVPNDLLRDKSLSTDARFFMALLLSYQRGWRFNRTHLSDVTGWGETRWERVVAELKEAGRLVIEEDYP